MEDKITKGIRSTWRRFQKQNNDLKRNDKPKRAFTLIELIVVMSVIAILVLLAAPKFLGYTQKAEETKHIHTAKVIETALDAYLINGGKIGNGLTIVESTILDEAVTNKNLINSKGYMVSVDTDTYYELTDAFIKANLDVKLSASRSTPFVVEAQASNLSKAPNAVYATSEGAVIINKEQTLKGYSDIVAPGGEIETPVEEVVTPPDLTKNPTVLIGAGTVESPYQIWYLEHLAYINTDATTRAANYVMMKDLDLNDDSHYLDISNKALWMANEGWIPIGTQALPFIGTFNGSEKTLTGLYINRPKVQYVGLFGYSLNGEIKNIGLINCNVTGGGNVGGLVGFTRGIISNAYTTGEISGNYQVGGLAGTAYGSITNSYSTGNTKGIASSIGGLVGYGDASITNSYATGNVSGTGYLGGLIGTSNYGIISSCYATGNVTGSGTEIRVGGLVGYNGKTIINSYATGKVIGYDYVGGLAGQSLNVTNSYAIGIVQGGNSRVGGLIGTYTGGSILSSYRLSVGKNTDGMYKSELNFKSGVISGFSGWNSTIWTFTAGQYPRLAWQK